MMSGTTKNNRVEDELDAIRINLYEKTKGMTASEVTGYIKKEIAQTVVTYNMPTLTRVKPVLSFRDDVVAL